MEDLIQPGLNDQIRVLLGVFTFYLIMLLLARHTSMMVKA